MRLVLAIILSLTFFSCQQPTTKIPSLDIIPMPDSVVNLKGFSNITNLVMKAEDVDSHYVSWLESLAIPITVQEAENNVNLILDSSLEKNSYKVEIQSEAIVIKLAEKSDFRNAMVTLWQIWELNDGKLALCSITDKAEFEYRGMHLDVCRHFFPVSDIKKYIDYLSYYKFNKFHWHLTEDQGWRIEIKKYPKLQEVAAFRDETLIGHYNDQPQEYDNKKYGGFYTQEEVKEIVEYAGSRGIDVIPEIEMPGHSQAAIAAYPELGCNNKDVKVATKWGVFDEVYCPTDETFEFLENVLDEVVELFPYPYMHIGGDECPKISWKNSAFCQNLMKEKNLKDEDELQSYFISRMSDYLATKGRSIIGWDEIMEGGLKEGAVVMSWRGIEGGIEAAKMGHKVIMTPGSHCYFDHYQSPNSDEPVAIGGLTTVSKVYSYEVVPNELSDLEREYIWGAQGNVWTEYIGSFDKVEYMALARMIALSEVLHVDKSDRDYESFQQRLTKHISYWKSKSVNIADHQLDVTTSTNVDFGKGVFTEAASSFPNATIEATLSTNDKVTNESNRFELAESGTYVFKANNGQNYGKPTTIIFDKHLGTDAQIKLTNSPSDRYNGSGATSVINGILGSNEKYGGPEWLGFSGEDFEASITLPQSKKIEKINLRFFNGEGQWIYLPKQVTVQSSTDGQNYTLVKTKVLKSSTEKVVTVDIEMNIETKFLRITAENHGLIADGKQGAGHDAWLFVDEITLQ